MTYTADSVKARLKTLGLGMMTLMGQGKELRQLATALDPGEIIEAAVNATPGDRTNSGLVVLTSSRLLVIEESGNPPLRVEIARDALTGVAVEAGTMGLKTVRVLARGQTLEGRMVQKAEASRFEQAVRAALPKETEASAGESAASTLAILDAMVGFGKAHGAAASALPARLAAALPAASDSGRPLVVAAGTCVRMGDDTPAASGITVVTAKALYVFPEDIADPSRLAPGAPALTIPLSELWFVGEPQKLDSRNGKVEGGILYHRNGDFVVVTCDDRHSLSQIFQAICDEVLRDAPADATPEQLQPSGVISRRRIRPCIYLGGYGLGLATEEVVGLDFLTDGITLHRIPDGKGDPSILRRIPYVGVRALAVSGPGTVSEGGGFGGGGFGVGGAVTGMAAAAVLNKLTTRTSTNTLLKLVMEDGEGLFHFGLAEPEDLELALSPVFGKLRQVADARRAQEQASQTLQVGVGTSDDPLARLERLAALRASGDISDEEFVVLKRKLMAAL